MNTKNEYNKTIRSCFVAYIVQAIVNNFVPLLFLTFQRTYDIPLSQITMLITFNFGVQLLVDLLSVSFVDRLGYRFCMVLDPAECGQAHQRVRKAQDLLGRYGFLHR